MVQALPSLIHSPRLGCSRNLALQAIEIGEKAARRADKRSSDLPSPQRNLGQQTSFFLASGILSLLVFGSTAAIFTVIVQTLHYSCIDNSHVCSV